LTTCTKETFHILCTVRVTAVYSACGINIARKWRVKWGQTSPAAASRSVLLLWNGLIYLCQ